MCNRDRDLHGTRNRIREAHRLKGQGEVKTRCPDASGQSIPFLEFDQQIPDLRRTVRTASRTAAGVRWLVSISIGSNVRYICKTASRRAMSAARRVPLRGQVQKHVNLIVIRQHQLGRENCQRTCCSFRDMEGIL